MAEERFDGTRITRDAPSPLVVGITCLQMMRQDGSGNHVNVDDSGRRKPLAHRWALYDQCTKVLMPDRLARPFAGEGLLEMRVCFPNVVQKCGDSKICNELCMVGVRNLEEAGPGPEESLVRGEHAPNAVLDVDDMLHQLNGVGFSGS